MVKMVEMSWWLFGLSLLATVVVYTFLLLLALKSILKGQKGRFLFNLPIAPFSVESRKHTIAKHLGVEVSEVEQEKDEVYSVRGKKFVVEGFFGVVVHVLDESGKKAGSVSGDVSRYNLPNLRHDSGETSKNTKQQ